MKKTATVPVLVGALLVLLTVQAWAQTLGQIASYLRTEPYPAYVIDDRFAYWAANPAAANPAAICARRLPPRPATTVK